jgi:hypothetical protein
MGADGSTSNAAAGRARTLPDGLLRAYRLGWWILAALALAAATYGQYRDYRAVLDSDTATYPAGISWSPWQEAIGSPVSVEAAAAGIAEGQHIVAVDGRPVPTNIARRPLALAAIAGDDGTPVVITTVGPDGVRRDHRLTRRSAHVDAALADSGLTLSSRQAVLALSRTAHGLFMITVAALLFRRCGRDAVAALLSLAMLFWAIAGAKSSALPFDQPAVPLVADRIRFGLFTVALLLFPGGRIRHPWLRIVMTATIAVAAIGVVEAFRLGASRAYLPLAIACLGAAIAALFQRFRMLPPGAQRQQVKWVALALVAGFVLAVSSRLGAVLAPAMPGPMGLYRIILRSVLFDAGTMLMASGFLVALLRYRLYDADTVISRSAAYAALTLALVATFAGSEAVIAAIVGDLAGDQAGAASGAIAAALSAAMIAPLHARVTDWADRRFQRGLVMLRDELPRAAGDLRESLPLPRFAAEMLERIEAGVGMSRSAVVVGDRVVAARGVDPDRAAVDDHEAFPLRLALDVEDVGTVGWLLLGARADGSRHGDDEVEVLQAVAPAIARAVHIICERARREAEYVALAGDVVRRLDAIEARISALAARR